MTDDTVSVPVAWIEHHKGGDNLVWDQPRGDCTPLYSASPQPSGWIKCSERLPEGDMSVLCISLSGVYTCKPAIALRNSTAESIKHGRAPHYTHWMPLPPAPEEGLQRRCSCGWPDASCTRTQTDCVKWKP